MIRFHPITGEPLLLAPARAERPNTFSESAASCPFCPGNEHETPPEVARTGEPWRIRVFPNKYPATEHHEVIVESPRHEGDFDNLDEAVSMYAARYRELISRDGVQSVCIFKNHGAAAGASIEHMHSQIIGTSFVPPRVAREGDAFARAQTCPLCAGAGVVIDENESFVWLATDGAAMPYQQWIVPRRHANEMRETGGLAPLLARAARATLAIAPAFNWIFMSFPRTSAAHWYVELFPRLATIAGFEIGSGSAINIVDPTEAAAALGGGNRPSAR